MTAQPVVSHEGGPLIPVPEKTPAALRVAVTRLDPAEALPRFDRHWEEATREARDTFTLTSCRAFLEHWFTWVAVHRLPDVAARLDTCERIVAESSDRAERRAASAEIGRILATAQESDR
ncbi:hypothetical protein OK074_0580 [Actinobacteria bacterium OK074]|nr:hypothetical protein OK074_0580 [Actinobacteria bacterium OK074]